MRFVAIFLIILISINPIWSKKLDVDLFSKNVILLNPKNNAILYEKNAYDKVFPASITKIATALYMLDSKKSLLEETAEVSKEAVRSISSAEKVSSKYKLPPYLLEMDGTSYGLAEGEVIPIRTLLYGMMLVSGNDCANVISEAASGTIPNFMDELNRYLKSINCQNTHFVNPHGLHHPDHYTNAYDMALITKKALSIPMFRQVVSTLSYTTAGTNKHKRKDIVQFNRLMKKGKYYYPYAIGVKTGYHSNAGFNLVAAAEKDNRILIAVCLGAEKGELRYLDAKKLFEAAFSEELERRVIFDESKIFTVKVEGAKKNLQAYFKEGLFYEYYPSEEMDFKVFVKWDDLKLPIKKEAKVGEVLLVSKDGSVLASSPLYSKEKVRRTFMTATKDFFKNIF